MQIQIQSFRQAHIHTGVQLQINNSAIHSFSHSIQTTSKNRVEEQGRGLALGLPLREETGGEGTGRRDLGG